MRRLNSLEEFIHHIQSKHTALKTNEGVYGMKFLKKPNGRRILIEEFTGFRTISYKVHEPNNLVITQYASGFKFKGNEKIQMCSKLYLSDLVVANAYDHSAEFFTLESIDFAYAENGHVAEMELLDEMFQTPGPIRAQWTWDNPEIEKLLEELDRGRKIRMAPTVGRGIDLTINL